MTPSDKRHCMKRFNKLAQRGVPSLHLLNDQPTGLTKIAWIDDQAKTNRNVG